MRGGGLMWQNVQGGNRNGKKGAGDSIRHVQEEDKEGVWFWSFLDLVIQMLHFL